MLDLCVVADPELSLWLLLFLVGKGEHCVSRGAIMKLFCSKQVTNELLTLLVSPSPPFPITETGNTEGCVRDPDPVHHHHGPLIQSKRRNTLRRLRRGRKAPQALTSPDLGLKNSLVQMREEELEGPL